jgi:hypothetical protein
LIVGNSSLSQVFPDASNRGGFVFYFAALGKHRSTPVNRGQPVSAMRSKKWDILGHFGEFPQLGGKSGNRRAGPALRDG